MVTIIPKPPQKIPPWQDFLFYFSLATLATGVVVYFVLNYLEGRSSATLQTLEKEVATAFTPEDKEVEDEILATQSKMEDFAALLSEHQKSSQFFKFLASSTHPRLWFSELTLSPPQSQVTVRGFTENFKSLAQQIYIFEEQDLIEEIKLSDLSLGEGGEAQFSLQLSLFPEVFK